MLCQGHAQFFLNPENNGSAIKSSPANCLHVSSVLQKCQDQGSGNSGCFHTDRPMKDFCMLSQSNKVPLIS